MNNKKYIADYIHQRLEENENHEGYPFVTISREAGAGGHRLAETLLKQINDLSYRNLFQHWRIFDKEICELLAQDPKLNISTSAIMREEYHSDFEDTVHYLIDRGSSQYAIYARIFQLMYSLATIGKVILIGRAGVCVTHKLKNGIHVRLIASEASRLKRMAALFDSPALDAKQMMLERDREREKLARDFFNQDIRDQRLYDFVFDTDKIHMNEMAEKIIQAVQVKSQSLNETLEKR